MLADCDSMKLSNRYELLKEMFYGENNNEDHVNKIEQLITAVGVAT